MEENTNEILSALMTTYIAQMDSALKISELISEHGNYGEIRPDDIIIGLVYRLMTPMDEKELSESMEKGKKITDDILKGSDSEEDYETELDLSPEVPVEVHGDKVILARKVKTNNCNCDICIRARTCMLNYHTHEVNDELAEKFKNAIDNACGAHGLMI